MISNASTPLIGVVDTAVVGQIPDPAFIGAAHRMGLAAAIKMTTVWAATLMRYYPRQLRAVPAY